VAPAGGAGTHRKSASFEAEERRLEDELMALTGGVLDPGVFGEEEEEEEDAAVGGVGGAEAERDAAGGGVYSKEAAAEDSAVKEDPSAGSGLASAGDGGRLASAAVSAAVSELEPPRPPSAMMLAAARKIRGAKDASSTPSAFFCPITTDVMTDPVIAWDGHTYERTSIARWLKEHSTSPMTGETLPDFTLRPNHSMRSQIINFGEQIEG
jgi:hypothetical protein